jgi:hypothetical protein
MKRIATIVLLAIGLAGCAAKQPAAPPVPGSINTLDAYAYRVVSDAQAAIHSLKGWETCSDQKFPPSVTFDNQTFNCDSTAGPFPAKGRSYLLDAERAYNIAEAAGQSYHAGASNDTTGLTNALNQLSQAIAAMLSSTGGK